MQRASRMKRELEGMLKSPPPGVSCWLPDESRIDQLEASILGPEGTPYEGGVFKLKVTVPERYPFEPPQAQFLTKIYHPNIDDCGIICLDVLKMPPKGSWKPSLDVASILASIRLLLSEPNPKDPLVAEIAQECQLQPLVFQEKARSWTRQFCEQNDSRLTP